MKTSALNVTDPNSRDVNKIWLTSGELAVNTLVSSKGGILGAIVVTTDGSNDALCVVYDSTDATGKIIARCPVKGADGLGGIVIPKRRDIGLYVTISGSGAKYIVDYL